MAYLVREPVCRTPETRPVIFSRRTRSRRTRPDQLHLVDPQDDPDRSGPVHVLGGDLEALWDYDPHEEERSDDYRLGDLAVTVSSFLVSTIDAS